MIYEFLSLMIKFFSTLPANKKEEIIDTIIDLFRNAFKKKKKDNQSDTDSNDDLRKYASDITETQWQGTAVSMMNILPVSLPQGKKKQFTATVLNLVQSDKFLEELERRIDKIDIKENDLYEEQCSFEMRKLIAEMLRN